MKYDYDPDVATALDSLGTGGSRASGRSAEVERAVRVLNEVLEDEYPGFGGLDETAMYGELAVRVAIRFARAERERAAAGEPRASA